MEKKVRYRLAFCAHTLHMLFDRILVHVTNNLRESASVCVKIYAIQFEIFLGTASRYIIGTHTGMLRDGERNIKTTRRSRYTG